MSSDLDRDVAIRVMGWGLVKDSETAFDFHGYYSTPTWAIRLVDWSPSTNIAHAFEVVEKMRERGWGVDVGGSPKGRWTCMFGRAPLPSGREGIAEADTVPEAICRAALQAVEQEEKGLKLVVVIDGDRFEAQDEDSSYGAARIKQAMEEWAEHVKSIREATRPAEKEDNDAD